MSNARDMRLQSDYQAVLTLANGSGGTLTVDSVQGRPPDHYLLAYRVRSIERLEQGKPIYRDLHLVKVRLPSRYPAPSAPPVVQLLTPIFHPHVYPNRTVCLGQWQTSEFLDELVLRIGAMLQFDRRGLNIKDPANEAAVAWAQKNMHLLPTDNCTFHNDDPNRTRVQPEEAQQRLVFFLPGLTEAYTQELETAKLVEEEEPGLQWMDMR